MAKSFPAKSLKILPGTFVEEVEAMSETEINKRLIEIEKGIASLKEDKEKDAELERLKLEAKEAGQTYSVPIKEHRVMIDYLVFVLQSRGKA